MPAFAREAAPPAGFQPVKATQTPTITVKSADAAQASPAATEAQSPTASETSQAPAGGDEGAPTPAPTESGVQVTEPDKIAKARKAGDQARKSAEHARQLRAQHDQLARQAAQQSQQVQNLQSQLEQNQRFMQQLAADPLVALKQLGVSADRVAKVMAAEGTPEALISEMRAGLQAQSREIESLKQEKVQEAERARVSQIEVEFKQEASNEKKYPNLSQIHPEFVLSKTRELVGELRRRGHDTSVWTNHDFLTYLESTYAKPGKPKVATAEPADAPESHAPKKTVTVTNKMQSSRQALPKDFSKMSDRDQRKAMADQLRQAGVAK